MSQLPTKENRHLKHDYTIPYTPRAESIKFFSWVNMMFDNDKNDTPKMHYQMIDAMLTRFQMVALEVFRGAGKSNLTSHKMPLYVAMLGNMPNFGYIKNAVLLSATFEQADTQLKSCAAFYKDSDKLQSFLDLVKEKEGNLVFENKEGKKFNIMARGAGQSFRGTNFEGQRPQWIIADDILPDDLPYMPNATDYSEKIKKWWTGTVMKAIDITGFKITAVGTPMLQDDIIANWTSNPKWVSVKFPVAEEFPVSKDKIISAWVDRFTPESIMDMYEDAKSLGTENEFFREMMLEVINEDMRVIKEDWIKYFKYKDFWSNKHQFNFFTSMDLAVSKKQHADYSVIMTIGVNADGHWYLARMDRGKFNPSQVIDKLFEHVRTFKPIETRAEKAALQQVLDHFIEQKMHRENTHFFYQPLENNSVQKKEYRMLSLQPKFKHRMIYLPEDKYHDEVAALVRELLGLTREGSTTKNDDAADCIANFNDPNFVFLPSDYKKEDGVVYNGEMSFKDPTIF